MRRIALSIIYLLLFTVVSYSQRIMPTDTVIVENCYISAYSYEIQGPSYVVYKLYKGGGDVPRKGMNFKEGSLPHFTYYKSGYDRGHLVPAEDFAYDKNLMTATFKYHNCLPQTPNLNRGKWKIVENRVRELSQTDSLLVVTGAYEYDANKVPKRFFKIAYRLPDGYCLYAVEATNLKKSELGDSRWITEFFEFYVVEREYRKQMGIK